MKSMLLFSEVINLSSYLRLSYMSCEETMLSLNKYLKTHVLEMKSSSYNIFYRPL